jgi:hypothetical protein
MVGRMWNVEVDEMMSHLEVEVDDDFPNFDVPSPRIPPNRITRYPPDANYRMYINTSDDDRLSCSSAAPALPDIDSSVNR